MKRGRELFNPTGFQQSEQMFTSSSFSIIVGVTPWTKNKHSMLLVGWNFNLLI